jgi:hypothetical protein
MLHARNRYWRTRLDAFILERAPDVAYRYWLTQLNSGQTILDVDWKIQPRTTH